MVDDEEYPIAKFVRLQNGDDLICQLVELEEDEYSLYLIMNPLKIVYVPTQSGNLQIAFMPWVFPKLCSGQEFTINPEDVLLISDASVKMNTYYWENLDYYHNMYDDGKDLKEELEEVAEEDKYDDLKEIMEILSQTKRTFH